MNTIFRSIDMDIVVDTAKRTIIGRAATFGVLSKPVKDSPAGVVYKETIAKGAFKRSLESGKDIMSFKEHDTKMILGRLSANTLKVEERDDGLYVEINVPNTTFGNDLLESVSRKDITGFSFGFKPVKSRTYTRGDEKIVERVDVDLIEVSPTARPAYDGTEMNLRSEDEVWESEEPTLKPDEATAEAYKQKLRFQTFVMNQGNPAIRQ